MISGKDIKTKTIKYRSKTTRYYHRTVYLLTFCSHAGPLPSTTNPFMKELLYFPPSSREMAPPLYSFSGSISEVIQKKKNFHCQVLLWIYFSPQTIQSLHCTSRSSGNAGQRVKSYGGLTCNQSATNSSSAMA